MVGEINSTGSNPGADTFYFGEIMTVRKQRVAEYNELTEKINANDGVGGLEGDDLLTQLTNARERIWNSSTDEEKRLMNPNWGKIWYQGQEPKTGNLVTWLDHEQGGADGAHS